MSKARLLRDYFAELQLQEDDERDEQEDAELAAEYGDESELDWQEYKESSHEEA